MQIFGYLIAAPSGFAELDLISSLMITQVAANSYFLVLSKKYGTIFIWHSIKSTSE